MPETINIDGRTFAPIAQIPFPEWNSVISEHPIPTLTLKDDDLFLITDLLGNIAGTSRLYEVNQESFGLFCRDTRFLSRLELQIDEKLPVLLSSDAQKGYSMTVLCANPQLGDRIRAETIGIEREIVLNGSLFEEIKITNYNTHPVSFTISLTFEADFADLFEIRGYSRENRGKLLRVWNEETPENVYKEITLAYLGLDNTLMESRLAFNSREPDEIRGYTALWHLQLEPQQNASLGYHIQMFVANHPASKVYAPLNLIQAKAAEFLEEQTWYEKVTRIRCDNRNLNRVIEQAERDVFHLRQTFGEYKVLAAGVPWFSTLFGRDSIIGASQTLIFDPAIAKDTLCVLAQYQGKVDDDWKEEEPGKILHEIRFGEMARTQEIPHTPYYGTVDATPLWLMLYAEYYAWTRDGDLLERLWDDAIAAMDWIDRNLQETGYLAYNRRSRRGLINQGWKDSGDCIVDRRGHLAQGAIALCEVQAYVYAAKIRMSELAKEKKQYDLAQKWQEEARALKVRFNRDFWLDDLDYCALALDGEGKPVDSITSNPGHCLLLGIFDQQKAHSIAERMQAPDMYNGWGIRTLSSLSPAYNPMGYHVGSVWPHDNSLIVMGLRSLGLIEQALEIAQGLLDMTLEQPYQRPPELFCGYERSPKSRAVRYPVACSPQAWASGTIFQLLQMICNLVPDASQNCLRIIDPMLPKSMNHLSIENLKIGQTLLSLEFDRANETTACRVTKKRGNLRVIIET
ncbi:MAG: amylo-alpha-1,6-glucosidase [Hydrococcus sp. Prado102]|jgi:glycogen debranching enzyme|nr:amylo-alpha-1,6-glucosidase [Hydrococcus sp. Prado102]